MKQSKFTIEVRQVVVNEMNQMLEQNVRAFGKQILESLLGVVKRGDELLKLRIKLLKLADK